MKKCSKCGELKADTEFYPKRKDGKELRARCKTCCSKSGRAWYVKHCEEILAREKTADCVDCSASISGGAKRCKSCENKRRWRDIDYRDYMTNVSLEAHKRGAYDHLCLPSNYCVDCGEEIWPSSKRCKSCDFVRRWADPEYHERVTRAMSNGMKEAWARGDFDGIFTEEWRRKHSEAAKRRWECGDLGSEEWCRKISEAVKEAWRRGDFDSEETRRRMSEATRKQWACGNRDSIFRSPTSIELQVAAALDIMGVEHESQYRPDDYSRIYDEFVPPNILIEVHGDYFHSEEYFSGIEKRDAEKAAWAKDHGYKLIVIWEHEINEVGAWSLVMERVGRA